MTASSKPPPGKPAGTYSRFIPREELGSFAAWDPGTLQGAADGSAGEAQAAPADAPNVQALVAAARQSGYQDGYRDGLAALDSFKQSFARQMAAQVGVLVGNFHGQLDALEAQMAQAMANASVMLARRVVRSELLAHPEQVAHAAQQAVNAVLLSAGHIKVTVNPEGSLLEAKTSNNASYRLVVLGGSPGNRTVSVPAFQGINSG